MITNTLEGTPFINSPPERSRISAPTTELGVTRASEPRTGSLLQVLAASKPGGRFLELGTGTGIATAWLLEGMDSSSSIISIDNDALVQGVARECLGDDPRLTLETADGIEFLRAQPSKSFDMVFADAMPG